ncbi:uncharacterized protein LOC124328590 [Daphnia pulicaria]|uniref:uncharacterized protein LOC124328590 n=1 Tax=Daphnia pulicaria TaxID=35523 RepID=UPI001EEA0B0B|nr:uncharacterized protein LOC124328590 [Daphnia pulicaria]
MENEKTFRRKMTLLSGGWPLDPHVESGFNYKYFPIDSVLRFNLVEDLVLWRQGYSSHLEESILCTLKPENMINIDTMIVGIMGCLFSRNKVILQHFQNFEATFEKSSIISTILGTAARKHGPYLDVVLCTSIMKNWFYPQTIIPITYGYI